MDSIAKSCDTCKHIGPPGTCDSCAADYSNWEPKENKQICSTCSDQGCIARGATDEMECECGDWKPTPEPKPEPKLCPLYTKRHYEYDYDYSHPRPVRFTESEFLPCIGDKCGWWVNGCAIPMLANRSFTD